MNLDGVPVLFIPGNAGSYKQGIVFHINNLVTLYHETIALLILSLHQNQKWFT